MKHASRIPTHPLQVRIRRLGFNPNYLTAAEQQELITLEEILSSEDRGDYAEAQPAQKLLVSP
jgi:hypothetical protein